MQLDDLQIRALCDNTSNVGQIAFYTKIRKLGMEANITGVPLTSYDIQTKPWFKNLKLQLLSGCDNYSRKSVTKKRTYFNEQTGIAVDQIELSKGEYYIYFTFLPELKDEIDNAIADIRSTVYSYDGRISLIAKEYGELTLIPFDIRPVDISEEHRLLNYGSDFKEVDNKIKTFLTVKEQCGLILLHGTPGTGKTTYIRSLINEIKGSPFIFISPEMFNCFADPQFVNFISEHRGSIVVLEDAEKIVKSREDENSQSIVGTLLNLTDGLLGDMLQLKFICTFNAKDTDIDVALKRKGRLKCSHFFDKLNVEDANKLINHLGKNHITTEPMALSDIYYLEDKVVGKDEKKGTIGFG